MLWLQCRLKVGAPQIATAMVYQSANIAKSKGYNKYLWPDVLSMKIDGLLKVIHIHIIFCPLMSILPNTFNGRAVGCSQYVVLTVRDPCFVRGLSLAKTRPYLDIIVSTY